MRIKNTHVLNLFFITLLTGCATLEHKEYEVGYASQVPTPVEMPDKVETLRLYDAEDKSFKEIPVATLNKSQIRDLLTNTSTKITVQKKDTSGNFKIIPLGVNLQKGEYKITYDFTNSLNQQFEVRKGVTTNGQFGVGVRLAVLVVTNSKSVDITGLVPLFVSARSNKLTGSLKFETFGIKHPKIFTAHPDNLKFDEDSLQKVFEAIAASKILINLDDTILEPYLLAYIEK